MHSIFLALSALFLWMASGISDHQENTFPTHQAEGFLLKNSGKINSTQILEHGLPVQAEEPTHVHQDNSEADVLRFDLPSGFATTGFSTHHSVPLGRDVALNFTTHDLVYPFHEFT